MTQSGNSGVAVRATPLRDQLTQQVEPQILPVLIEIDPPDTTGNSAGSACVVFVIDRSGSMEDDGKIEQVRAALRAAVHAFRPTDTCGLIVFNHDSQVLVPQRQVGDGREFFAAIDAIEAGGGTRMSRGLSRALSEVTSVRANGVGAVRVVLLTDGHTDTDEAECAELAQRIATERAIIDGFGLGDDWNSTLVETIAATSGGTIGFITDASTVEASFRKAVARSQATALTDCRLRLRLVQTTSLVPYSVYRLSPDIVEMQPPGYGGVVDLVIGDVAANEGVTVFAELSIPAGTQGRFRPVRAELLYRPASGGPEGSITSDIIVSVGEGAYGASNPRVESIRTELSKMRLQKSIDRDLKAGNTDTATRKLEALTQRLSAGGDTASAAAATQLLAQVKSGEQSSAPSTIKLEALGRDQVAKTVRLAP